MLNFARFAQVMFGLRQMGLVSASVPVLSVNTTMGGGLHNASHLCCHRPGGAAHVEVLEAKAENPRRVNHDMATAQENLESSSFSGDNLGWSNCSSQRIANMRGFAYYFSTSLRPSFAPENS